MAKKTPGTGLGRTNHRDDGAFASKANLGAIKKLGTQDVVFSKGQYLKVSDMAKSLYVYRKLRDHALAPAFTVS